MPLKISDRELLFLSELAKGCTLNSAMLRASMDSYMVANLVTRLDIEKDERKRAREEVRKNDEELAKLKKNTIPPSKMVKKKKAL